MKIQRGVVQYKGRSDIVCTYGTTDDGQQFFFLDANDETKLSNGNRVVTTELVEAIDQMVKATHVGVIDQNGVVVVPCENRSVRPYGNILIVEKANPTSQSVVDAIALRNDPAAATQLVSSSASIKDKLRLQMGEDGNYLFNDQFSEATICDINGTNLVQGNSYSFISMANNILYLSKNTVDSPVFQFSLTTYELIESQSVASEVSTDVEVPVADGSGDVPAEAIDVSNTIVDSNVVEGALASETVAVQEAVDSADVVNAGSVETPTTDGVGNEQTEMTQSENAMTAEEVTVPVADNVSVDAAIPTDNNVVETPIDSNVMATETPEMPTESMSEEKSDEIASDNSSGITDVTASNTEVVDTNEMPMDVPTDMNQDTSISDDLKAFADGVPSDEEELEKKDEIPPVVEEESEIPESENAEALTDINNIVPEGETEKVVASESEESVTDVTSDSTETYESGSNNDIGKTEETTTITDDVPKEEVFSSNVTSTSVESEKKEVKDESNDAPINIDAETVLATVDSDRSGEIDRNEEIMTPHDYTNNQETHSLVGLYDSPMKEEPRDYRYDTYSEAYSPSNNYGTYGSMLKDVKPDSIYDSYGLGRDNIMTDVARSMAELMRQIKDQKAAINQYIGTINSLETQNRIIREKYDAQSSRNEALTGELRSLKDSTTRLESKIQILESRIHDQEQIISSQDRDLAGKQELASLLADARALLGSEESSFSGYDGANTVYNRRVF